MFELLTHHQFWTAVAGYWIFLRRDRFDARTCQ